MKKRVLASLLCLCMIGAMIPAGVIQAGNDSPVVPRDIVLDLRVTDGSYQSTTGLKTGVNFTTTSVNDSVEGWSWDAENLILTLSGAQITAPPNAITDVGSAAIFLPGSENHIVLEAGTNSKIQGGEVKPTAGVALSYGIHATGGILTISGSGSLKVNSADAISVDQSAYSVGIMTSKTVIKGDAKVKATGALAQGYAGASSVGIVGQTEIEDNARVIARGGLAIGDERPSESSYYYAQSHGIQEAGGASIGVTISGNAKLVAQGGIAEGIGDRRIAFCSGVRAREITIKDNAVVEATGGTASAGFDTCSCGLLSNDFSDGFISIKDNATVTATGASAQRASYGIYSVTYSNGTTSILINGGHIRSTGNFGSLHANNIKVSPDTSLKMKIGVKMGDDEENATVMAGSPFTVATDIKDAVSGRKYFQSDAIISIFAGPISIDFGSTYLDYLETREETITIKNVGNQAVVLNDTADDTSAFVISSLSSTNLAAGEEVTFTARPKTNLGTGTYTHTVIIAGDNEAAAEVNLAFEVKRAEAVDANTKHSKTVWYGENNSGPLAWRIIGSALGGIAPSNGSITLLSSGHFGITVFNSEAGNNAYSASLLKEKIEGIVDSFSEKERNAIKPRDLLPDDYTASKPWSDGIAGDVVHNALLWPLSSAEAEALVNDGGVKNLSLLWWLRSPGEGSNSAYVYHGDTRPAGIAVNTTSYTYVRAALHLKEDSIVFFSPAEGGKIGRTMGADALEKLPDTIASELKVTIYDETNYGAFDISDIVFDGQEVNFSYSGAIAYDADNAPNEYISALIKDRDGKSTYYGKLVQPVSESGRAKINLPQDFDSGIDRLYVFAEQANADKKTDYASKLRQVSLVRNAYPISYSLTNLTTNGLARYIAGDNDDYYSATLTAAGGYKLPRTITVKVDGSALGVNDYNYSSISGELSIPKAKIIGSVAITASGVKISYVDENPGGEDDEVPSEGEDTPSKGTEEAGDGQISFDYITTGNTAKISLPTAKIDEIIQGSKENEAVLDLSQLTGLSAASLPKEALVAFEGDGLDLVLKLPAGTITIDKDAAASIAEQSDGDLTIEIRQLAIADLTDEQKRAIKENDMIFDINIFLGTKKITNFKGSVTIQIPYDGPQPVAVWYLNEKGELERLTGSFADGWITFSTNHLSYYVIGLETAWTNPFIDVEHGSWYYGPVRYVYENRLMVGTSGNTFSPDQATTRGMIVTILHRLEGGPAAGISPFDDVQRDKYYAAAVAWASENKVVSGYGNGKFGPENPVTREQLAAILMNYSRYKGYGAGGKADLSEYEDSKAISSWALGAMTWANAEGLIQGDGKNLMPTSNASRAQVAAILNRFIEKRNTK